jgi:hypothetical protein
MTGRTCKLESDCAARHTSARYRLYEGVRPACLLYRMAPCGVT